MHKGLNLAGHLAEAEDDLTGVCNYARAEILKLGILSANDPRYGEITLLQEGVLDNMNDRQAFFRYIYHAVNNAPVFPTEFSKMLAEDATLEE